MGNTLLPKTGMGMLSAVFLALLPFVVSRHLFYGAVNAKLFFFVGFVSLVAVLYGYTLYAQRRGVNLPTVRRPIAWSLLAVLGVHYIAAFLGVYPEASLWADVIRSTGVIFLTYLVFISLWSSAVFQAGDWMRVRTALAFSGGLFAFLTILGSEGIGLSGRVFSANLAIDGLTLGNSTFAGAFLFIAFVATLIQLSVVEEFKTRCIYSALAVIQFASPLLTNTGILLGRVPFSDVLNSPFLVVGTARASGAVAIATVVYMAGWWIMRRVINQEKVRRWAHGLWSVGCGVGILVALTLLFTPGSFVQEKYIEESSDARIIVWESSFKAIAERPLFGWGPENFHIAFDTYFDNRLYLEESTGEVWFDRAHNIVVDTLVATGFLGIMGGIVLFYFLFSAILRARRGGVIGDAEMHLLGIMLVGHFVQLQTSFDTVTTYVVMSFFVGYILWLDLRLENKDVGTSLKNKKVVGSALLAIGLIGAWIFLIGEYGRQKAFFAIFTAQNAAEQIPLIEHSLARVSAFEYLRLSSASFIKGLHQRTASLDTEDVQAGVALGDATRQQFDIYDKAYRAYLAEAPHDYRARMNYVYLLISQTVFAGESRLDEASVIVAESYALSPNNPLTYALDGILKLYTGDRARARELIEQAAAMNPNARFGKEMLAYLERQEKKFPSISVIYLENL